MNGDLLKELFLAHKEHIDYRFDELHQDLSTCHTCHEKVEIRLAGKIKDLEDSDKKKLKKQMIAVCIFGLIGGAVITLLDTHLGGILGVILQLF